MTCPRCDEYYIRKIRFKKSGNIAYTCDFCEALWFEGEYIENFTARTRRSLYDNDFEYICNIVENNKHDARNYT